MFSQGYSIFNDNFWLDVDGVVLEEFYVIGICSFYGMFFDEENEQIWLVDVGSDKREEINFVNWGENLQWFYCEGICVLDIYVKFIDLIGQECGLFFEYDCFIGFCMIGGGIYCGMCYLEFSGKFFFVDWMIDKFMVLININFNELIIMEIFLGSFSGQLVLELENVSIIGIYEFFDGYVFLIIMGGDGYGFDLGKILCFKR